MTPDPIERQSVPRCSARTQATASQLAVLSELPDPAEPVAQELVCELADGHDDVHVALVVASHGGDQWWWLRWARLQHDIVQIDPCEATERDAPDPEYCLLPAGHPGSHSFHVVPTGDSRVGDDLPETQPVIVQPR